MREAQIATISDHAGRRLAQRNLSNEDASYVLRYGRSFHTGNALFIHLGRRDIPIEHQRVDRLRRLEGTILVFDPDNGHHLTTAYRNRSRGCRDIKHKTKRAFPRQRVSFR